jgi:isoleucyl-tRNA synthetase
MVVVEARELGPVQLSADDVVVTETPREGWAVVSEGGESVALDLALDDELRRAGAARELVRSIQEARKASGLDISDRIRVWWSSDDTQLIATWAEHGDAIAVEVLALTIRHDEPAPAEAVFIANELGLSMALQRAGA